MPRFYCVQNLNSNKAKNLSIKNRPCYGAGFFAILFSREIGNLVFVSYPFSRGMHWLETISEPNCAAYIAFHLRAV